MTCRLVARSRSLADNKAALGRRYAEWAVSAPTLESAVAAAAMAQDELGHARSTYPVLKALGMEAEEHGVEGGPRRLALLDDELPDWTSFIAANLLVDGVLATFVSACVDSSVAPMAQRARKILQEEGSHRVHAEAWARRLCRAGAGEREALVARAARHVGARRPLARPRPTIPTSARPSSGHAPPRRRPAARARARVAGRPARRRGRVDRPRRADRLVALGPRDATLRAVSAAPTCPFCDAATVERVAQWGGQMITAQWRCQACGSYFEALREEFEDAVVERSRHELSRDGRMRPEADAPCDRTATAAPRRIHPLDRWCCAPSASIMEGMITVDHVSKRYGDKPAVDDLTFTVRPGHRHRLPRPERRRASPRRCG